VASAESLKLSKPEEPKSLIAINREGGHASIDKELREKMSVEELRFPKAEVPNCIRAIDLRCTYGARYRTSGTKYSGGKRRVKASKS
jgi:hypothetical protein